MTTVLVTAIGSFSADIVIKSLKKHGIRTIGCDIFPKEWIVNAYSVDSFYRVSRGTDCERYISEIKDICAHEKVEYLFPLTDAEIDALNENRTWFQENRVQICFSSKNTIDICRDKYRSYQLLKNQNLRIQIIPTIIAADYQEKSIPDFPMVCKPLNGRSSQGMRRIYNKNELQSYLNMIDSEQYIVQPLISGLVVTVDVVRQAETGTVICVPRKELLRTVSGAGTSVHIFHDEMLLEECRKIADCLDIQGCVNFEFIESPEGTYYFLECNPRFSGGVKFSCMTGNDLVLEHLNCFSGKSLGALNPYQDCYIARKYEETITAIG